MQVLVPVGDCRLAITAAILAVKGKLAEAREEHRHGAFEALFNGAVHNGLEVNDARRNEMNEMVDRDVDHIMERHPLHDHLKVFEVQLKMLDYTDEDQIIVDENDFHLFGEYLPTSEKAQAA